MLTLCLTPLTVSPALDCFGDSGNGEGVTLEVRKQLRGQKQKGAIGSKVWRVLSRVGTQVKRFEWIGTRINRYSLWQGFAGNEPLSKKFP